MGMADMYGTVDDVGAEREATLIGAITDWVIAAKEQRATAIDLDAVRALDGIDRMHHNRNAVLLAAVRYCRQNPAADVLPSLLVVVHALADCDQGACWCSTIRLGQLLRRSDRSIRAAIARGQADGLLWVEERGGETNLLYLSIPEELSTAMRPVMALDALSEPSARRRGRPRTKTPEARLPPFCENPGSQASALNGKTPEGRTQKGGRQPSTES
jgi:hypothetical protein